MWLRCGEPLGRGSRSFYQRRPGWRSFCVLPRNQADRAPQLATIHSTLPKMLLSRKYFIRSEKDQITDHIPVARPPRMSGNAVGVVSDKTLPDLREISIKTQSCHYQSCWRCSQP